MKAQEITFEEICHIWQKELWPSRISPIETHSAMTWPFDGNQLEYDMDIFEYKPSFFGIFERVTRISGSGSADVCLANKNRGLSNPSDWHDLQILVLSDNQVSIDWLYSVQKIYSLMDVF